MAQATYPRLETAVCSAVANQCSVSVQQMMPQCPCCSQVVLQLFIVRLDWKASHSPSAVCMLTYNTQTLSTLSTWTQIGAVIVKYMSMPSIFVGEFCQSGRPSSAPDLFMHPLSWGAGLLGTSTCIYLQCLSWQYTCRALYYKSIFLKRQTAVMSLGLVLC